LDFPESDAYTFWKRIDPPTKRASPGIHRFDNTSRRLRMSADIAPNAGGEDRRMKKFAMMAIIAASALSVFADAPDVQTVDVQRKIVVTGIKDVPDILIAAFVKDGGRVRSWELAEGEELTAPDEGIPLSILSMPRSAAKRAGGLAKIDIDALIRAGTAFPQRILQPFDAEKFVRQDIIYRETIFYRVACVVGERAFLEPSGVAFEYVGLDPKERRWGAASPIARMDSVAEVDSASSSSFLPDSLFPGRYGIPQAFDGDPETAWSEGAKGPGIGEYFEVTFARPMKADSVALMPGWFQESLHRKNNRVKTLVLSLDGKETIASFKDSMTAQTVLLDAKKEFRVARFTIKEVYKTEKYDDTPIAEVQFLLGGKKIKVNAGNVLLPRTLLGEQDGRED
jgi:hypothetical protein